jgi:ATP-dependent RNA helicase DBP3
MSTETQPETKLSKEEKRLRKEAKKAKKAAAAAENVETADAEVVSSKKEKKRKREEGVEAVEPVVAEGEAVAESKKDKKKKKKEKAADVAVSTPEEDGESSVKAEKKDKKEKKAKKDKSNAESEAVASSSSAVAKPAVNKTFSLEHNAYLEKHNITLSPSLYPPQLAIQSLPIPQLLLDFLKQFANPTPIQACSWPALLDGRDVVGIAETGSGKTLAFGIPALNHLQNKASGTGGAGAGGKGKKGKGKSAIGVLVLAPTRELAMQSHENLEKAGKTLGIESICIYGGVSKQDQYRELNDNRVKIVVGTPGRVLDLANEGALDLSG